MKPCFAFLLLVAVSACTQATPVLTGDLDRPTKVALTCFQNDAPTELEACATEGQGYRLYFLESFRSRLGIVDLDDNATLDLDLFTPGTTGLPLSGQVQDMVATSDGTKLIISSLPGSLIFFDLSDHSQTLIPWDGEPDQLVTVPRPYGFDLFILSLDGNRAHRWALNPDGTEYGSLETIQNLPDSFSHIAVTADGQTILGVSRDGLRLWSLDFVSTSGWVGISLAPECADGLDNDSDGQVDGRDPDCAGPYNEETFAFSPLGSPCSDGIDNDEDGFTDLNDGGCDSARDHSEFGEGSACDDGFDNDGNGTADVAGLCQEDGLNFDTDPCADGIDNDGDGSIDNCEDGLELPHGAPCDNGLDDNHNGLIDLIGDAVCSSAGSLAESLPACSDGIDNDGDGLIDAEDTGCFGSEGHSERTGVSGGEALVFAHPSENMAYVLRGAQRDVMVVNLSNNSLNIDQLHPIWSERYLSSAILPDTPSEMVFVTVESEASGEEEATTEIKAYIAMRGGRIVSYDPVNHRYPPIDPDEEVEVVVGRPTLTVAGESKDIRFTLPVDVPHLGSVDEKDDIFFGIKPLAAPYETPTETWTLTSGGVVPGTDRTTGRIFESNQSFYDGGARFCTWGVEPGDILEINPGQNIACDDLSGEAFRVTVLEVSGNVLSFDPLSLQSGVRDEDGLMVYTPQASEIGLNPQCLVGPLNYRVRVPSDVFLVEGSRSGILHPWTESETGCVERGVDLTDYSARAKVGSFKSNASFACPLSLDGSDVDAVDLVPFENAFFSLTMVPGCSTSLEGIEKAGSVEDVVFTFTMTGGSVPSTVLSTSGNADLLVDPSGKRIFHVDDNVNAIYIFDPSDDTLDSTIF